MGTVLGGRVPSRVRVGPGVVQSWSVWRGWSGLRVWFGLDVGAWGVQSAQIRSGPRRSAAKSWRDWSGIWVRCEAVCLGGWAFAHIWAKWAVGNIGWARVMRDS